MIKIKLGIIVTFFILSTNFILLTNCEELEELTTNVTGKVYADSCKVVMAVKGDSDLLSHLDDIEGIDEVSLREPELFRGFDLIIGDDSLYNITMLSFGETYFLAVVDNGEVTDELDSLDHIGFYAESDTLITIPGSDSNFTYAIPKKINIQEGTDESDLDIKNFIQYRWFIKIYQFID
jgi:hypothetical protein